MSSHNIFNNLKLLEIIVNKDNIILKSSTNI